jgi:hypothetical protein
MIGFTIANPRFLAIDNVMGVSAPRQSWASWRWA